MNVKCKKCIQIASARVTVYLMYCRIAPAKETTVEIELLLCPEWNSVFCVLEIAGVKSVQLLSMHIWQSQNAENKLRCCLWLMQSVYGIIGWL